MTSVRMLGGDRLPLHGPVLTLRASLDPLCNCWFSIDASTSKQAAALGNTHFSSHASAEAKFVPNAAAQPVVPDSRRIVPHV
jgi:hypothetical protein